MARTAKSPNNIQVFRGSRARPDVFAQNSGTGCCDNGTAVEHDKLATRVRFDNALAHQNPTGANDKFHFPYGDGFQGTRDAILAHINAVGVGATISVLAIPTYAFVTGVGIHIAAEEPGLTFNLKTRNGLALPTGVVKVVSAEASTTCDLERTATDGSAASFQGFGALGSNFMVDIYGRDGDGEFSLEADELILEVASMPSSGKVIGNFDLTVSASYDIIHRADF